VTGSCGLHVEGGDKWEAAYKGNKFKDERSEL